MIKKILVSLALLAVATGIYFRLTDINTNQFFYYDEGLYLTMHRPFDELIMKNPPHSFSDVLKLLQFNLLLSLGAGKPLWLFLLHLRSFFGHFEAVYFTRILAAIFGILTLPITYLFARRYFQSSQIALLSVAVLALLPGHVYYSRLGMQETLSCFCLLTGFYFYLFSKRFWTKSVLSGLFFALAYFSNYRMIILPMHVLVTEMFMAFSEKKTFNFRRYLWSMLIFAGIIISLGALNNGSHLHVTIFWMLRQGESAQGHFSLLSLFSYPYVTFRLESIVFALFFFANLFFLWQRKWKLCLPFSLGMLQMMFFSLAHEKGLRYLCVVFPFMAMAASCAIMEFFQRSPQRTVKIIVIILALLMFTEQGSRAFMISRFKSDYYIAMQDLLKDDPNVKVMSTQAFVQNLFSSEQKNVIELPPGFEDIVIFQGRGYQYIMIDPQAYISYTKNDERFQPPLDDYAEFIVTQLTPIKEYDHFSSMMMERFVFEHNVNLADCLRFLKENKDGKYNKLRVYLAKDYTDEVFRRLGRKQ